MSGQNDPELEEMDERLGDLWSMTQAEQDYFGRIVMTVVIGFVVVFGCVAFFIAFR